MPTIRIATRKSPLALWQRQHAADLLRAAHPGLEVVLVPLTTPGDAVLARSRAATSGKALFLKELDMALLSGAPAWAVQSLKDVRLEIEGPYALHASHAPPTHEPGKA